MGALIKITFQNRNQFLFHFFGYASKIKLPQENISVHMLVCPPFLYFSWEYIFSVFNCVPICMKIEEDCKSKKLTSYLLLKSTQSFIKKVSQCLNHSLLQKGPSCNFCSNTKSEGYLDHEAPLPYLNHQSKAGDWISWWESIDEMKLDLNC